MHAFMATVLLRMAGLDTLDGDAEPEPPDGQPTQVEETIRRGKGNTVVGTNGMGQAAFLEKALKGCKRALFLDRLHGFAEQKMLQAGTRTSLGNFRNNRSRSLRAPQVGFSRRIETIMASSCSGSLLA